jgi:hypothetical protein
LAGREKGLARHQAKCPRYAARKARYSEI